MKKNEKKLYLIISMVSAGIIILALCIGLFLYSRSKPLHIEFFEDIEVGINEVVYNDQFVKKIENGEIKTERATIDTSTLGEKSVSLAVKPIFGSEKIFSFTITVVDREKPVITFKNRLETELGSEIDLLSGVTVSDNSGEKIDVSVEGDFDFNKIGEYKLKYIAADASGNKAEEEFTLSVVDREGPYINFTDRIETDVFQEIDLLKGVSAVDNSGEDITVTVEGSFDFGKVGEYKLKYVAADSSGNKTEKEFILSVVDREAPKIKFNDYFETTKGKEIDLFKGVSVSDNSGEEITVKVEGSYDFDKVGVYKLKYVAVDSSGNRTEEEFTLRVKEAEVTNKQPSEVITFTTSKGFSGEIRDGVTYIDGYLIANKTYSLPKTYGDGLTAETKAALNAMSAAARKDGLDIYLTSGFRSYSYQKGLYEGYVKRDGVQKADTYSARAGHSEHQSGLAFDVNIVNDSFIGTPEAIWLAENCYKFGLILRYPQGKTNETGYKYEPWHFRYVGVELATILYNDGDWITMEDYFGITSEYQQ